MAYGDLVSCPVPKSALRHVNLIDIFYRGPQICKIPGIRRVTVRYRALANSAIEQNLVAQAAVLLGFTLGLIGHT